MEKNNWKIGFWVLFTAVVVFSGTYFHFHRSAEKLKAEQEAVLNTVSSVDERIYLITKEKTEHDAKELVYSLPESILQDVLEIVGPNATVIQIANEYIINMARYYSIQASEKAGPIEFEGPDADRIESVEIQTKIKEKIKEAFTKELTPIDSIK